MARTTNAGPVDQMSSSRGSSASCCGPSDASCSGAGCCGKSMIALLIVISTVLNISANWYLARGTVNPLAPINVNTNVDKVADTLKQIQYDQAGGKDIYDLYMKLQALQAQGQKKKLEDQIKSLEGGAPAANPNGEPSAPSASKTLTDTQYTGIFKDSYVEGNSNALLTLVEYSDLECPYCIMQKKNGTIESLKKKYGDKINVIFKPLNLARHSGSDQKGWASLCVAKLGGADKYSKFYNGILNKSEYQTQVLFPLDKLSSLAKEVGVDQKKFDDCYNAKETETIYKNYTTEALALQVNGTPSTMVINNATKAYDIVSGAAPAASFETVVDKMLAAK